jgi:hypothetical protein
MKCGRRGDRQKKSKAEIDKELIEIRERMEQLTLKMQQEAKVHWRYEWPLKRKVKWHVQKLLARGQQQELKRWLRHVENLSDTERKWFTSVSQKLGGTSVMRRR